MNKIKQEKDQWEQDLLKPTTDKFPERKKQFVTGSSDHQSLLNKK